jgi:hypothetical protein
MKNSLPINVLTIHLSQGMVLLCSLMLLTSAGPIPAIGKKSKNQHRMFLHVKRNLKKNTPAHFRPFPAAKLDIPQ